MEYNEFSLDEMANEFYFEGSEPQENPFVPHLKLNYLLTNRFCGPDFNYMVSATNENGQVWQENFLTFQSALDYMRGEEVEIIVTKDFKQS